MSTTKTKKRKKYKNRVRLDRVLISIAVLGLILASTIYIINYNHKTKIDIPTFENFQKVKAVLQCANLQDEEPVDNTIKLDYPQELLSNVSSDEFSSHYMYVLDKTNGAILFDKNSNMKCYPASTTKILTSIVALEYINLDTIFTVGDEINFAETGSSLAYLVQGDELPLRDLLYGLMLPSGNDCAYTIAVNVARKVSGNMLLTDTEAVEYFVNLMNKKAQEIGMYDSHFLVPDGYHKKQHYITTQDMMKLLIYAENFEFLKEVTSTQSYTTTSVSGQEYTWINTNKLLDEETSYYYEGVNGFKTGFHDDAGNCLIITAKLNGREIYAILMKSATDITRYQDAKLILDAIYNPSEIDKDVKNPDNSVPINEENSNEDEISDYDRLYPEHDEED